MMTDILYVVSPTALTDFVNGLLSGHPPNPMRPFHPRSGLSSYNFSILQEKGERTLPGVTISQWITSGLAVWGAGLSSYLAWRQMQRDKYILRISLHPEIAINSNAIPTMKFVIVEIANIGFRTNHVRTLAFKNETDRTLYNVPIPIELPCKVDASDLVLIKFEAARIADSFFRGKGDTQDNNVICRVTCGDIHGNFFTSSPVFLNNIGSLAQTKHQKWVHIRPSAENS